MTDQWENGGSEPDPDDDFGGDVDLDELDDSDLELDDSDDDFDLDAIEDDLDEVEFEDDDFGDEED